MTPWPVAAALLLVPVLLQESPQTSPTRSGPTRVHGRMLADDNGPFPALGATLFWAAWAYKHDKPRLDSHLKLLSEHRFDYIRALGVVGRQPYWAGREVDWRWPDYKDIIAGLADYAYDRFGLRVEWTIFADADQMIPNREDRFRLIDTFLAMARGREHKIVHFEIANESWQNGFGGPEGIAEIRELAAHLAARTAIPVAISDSEGQTCADHLALYHDLKVEILTEHFSRDLRTPTKEWGPVLSPWTDVVCQGLPPVISSNEPIGPRSSVASETDPSRIVGAAISSYMAGAGLYVFHTDAGIWGREPITAMPNAMATLKGFSAMKRYLPADIANWQHYRQGAPEHPFAVAGAEAQPKPDTTHVVDILASVNRQRFFVLAVGMTGPMTLEARRAMTVDVIQPLTGAQIDRKVLRAGERVLLSEPPLVVLSGEFQ
jgi:hypothetical protein